MYLKVTASFDTRSWSYACSKLFLQFAVFLYASDCYSQWENLPPSPPHTHWALLCLRGSEDNRAQSWLCRCDPESLTEPPLQCCEAVWICFCGKRIRIGIWKSYCYERICLPWNSENARHLKRSEAIWCFCRRSVGSRARISGICWSTD